MQSCLKETDLPKKLFEFKLKERWAELVGSLLCRHCEPAFIENHILFVNVESGLWTANMHFMKPILLKKINKEGSPVALNEIRFIVRPNKIPGNARPTPLNSELKS